MSDNLKADRERLEEQLEKRFSNTGNSFGDIKAELSAIATRMEQRRGVQAFLEMIIEKMQGRVTFSRLDLADWFDEYRARYPMMGESGYAPEGAVNG